MERATGDDDDDEVKWRKSSAGEKAGAQISPEPPGREPSVARSQLSVVAARSVAYCYCGAAAAFSVIPELFVAFAESATPFSSLPESGASSQGALVTWLYTSTL